MALRADLALVALLAAPLGIVPPGAHAQDDRSGNLPDPAEQALEAGVDFDLGHGATPDPVRAREEYEIAASAGLPKAEFNLAVMLDSGVGTPIDRRQASLWYARAAANGFGRAAFNLAELYASGDGVPRSTVLARRWWHLAEADGIHATIRLDRGDDPATEALSPPRPAPVQLDPPRPHRPTASAELAWTVASMPDDGRFYLEVATIGADGSRQKLVWREVPVSAAVVPLPDPDGRYGWRVFLASAATGHYVGSDWTYFGAGGASPAIAPERSGPA